MVVDKAVRGIRCDAEHGVFDWTHSLTVPPNRFYGVRGDLDLIVVLSVLQFLILAVLRVPSIKLMNNEQRGHYPSDNQQDIHNRVLSDVPKPNIYIHLGTGSTMRPRAPVKRSQFALAHFLVVAHTITSSIHRLHITSIRAARSIPDTAQSLRNLFLFHLSRIVTHHRLHLHLVRLHIDFVRFRFRIVTMRPDAPVILSDITLACFQVVIEFAASVLHYFRVAFPGMTA